MTALVRWLLWIGAGLLLVFGGVSFVAPGWASTSFPWNVGPFMAQTIGAWALGTGIAAAVAAWKARVGDVYAVLIYCGLFGLGELVVAGFFINKLLVGNVLTWPYIGGLLALSAAFILALAGWLREGMPWRLDVPAGGFMLTKVPMWPRVIAVLVGAFVVFLAVGTLFAGPDGATATGQVFPEPMGLFSVKAFSAFLFAIAVSIASLYPARSLRPYRELGIAGVYLIVPITVAALLNLGLFDFAHKPGHIIYVGAYVVVAVVLAVAAWFIGRILNPPAARPQ
jgi:hypothetical protein